jgi:hypothetical protein
MTQEKTEKHPDGPKKKGYTGGRKAGAKNRFSRSALDNLEAVFIRMGSSAGLYKWAKKYPGDFYKIWGKRVPAAVELDAKVDGSVTVELVRFSDVEPEPSGPSTRNKK